MFHSISFQLALALFFKFVTPTEGGHLCYSKNDAVVELNQKNLNKITEYLII